MTLRALLKLHPSTISELTAMTGWNYSECWHHLRMLRRSGLVTRRNEGVFRYYASATDSREGQSVSRATESANGSGKPK